MMIYSKLRLLMVSHEQKSFHTNVPKFGNGEMLNSKTCNDSPFINQMEISLMTTMQHGKGHKNLLVYLVLHCNV